MSYNWVHGSAGSGIPPNAVLAGNDVDGAPIYVGRCSHEGDLIPAKVMPTKNVAYVSHSGNEIPKHQYEILCGTGFQWIGSASGHVPEDAVTGGSNVTGETLYIGRTHFNGSLTVGKIHPSHNCLYLPFGGAEHSAQQYEVLVAPRSSCQWITSSVYQQVPTGTIQAGFDTDGSPIYVGRAFHEGDQLPAKVVPSKQKAYVAWGGQEHEKNDYEVLCFGNVNWVPSAGGYIPTNAVIAGHTTTGEPLFIGRAHYNGSLVPGKVHQAHHTLYIPFDGREVSVNEYEVLVEN